MLIKYKLTCYYEYEEDGAWWNGQYCKTGSWNEMISELVKCDPHVIKWEITIV